MTEVNLHSLVGSQLESGILGCTQHHKGTLWHTNHLHEYRRKKTDEQYKPCRLEMHIFTLSKTLTWCTPYFLENLVVAVPCLHFTMQAWNEVQFWSNCVKTTFLAQFTNNINLIKVGLGKYILMCPQTNACETKQKHIIKIHYTKQIYLLVHELLHQSIFYNMVDLGLFRHLSSLYLFKFCVEHLIGGPCFVPNPEMVGGQYLEWILIITFGHTRLV